MRGVQFGEFHTADDWDLILNSKSINPPTPKYMRVAVDGRDGDINLSRALTGELSYSNRDVNFTFLMTDKTIEERETLLTEIINYIHGKELKIIEPDKLDYYLLGECSIQNVQNNKSYSSFSVSATCEPYYYANEEKIRSIALTSTPAEIILTNLGRRIIVPTIKVSNSVNLEYDTTKVSLGPGTYKLTSLTLKPGSNVLKASGSGTVVFTYREAVL